MRQHYGMTNRKAIGNTGEEATISFLIERDYEIIDTNIRPIGGRSRGELDIVAWHGEYLVFIEVKTRTRDTNDTLKAVESINWKKRRQLVKLAYAYINRYKLHDVPCRFDVVEVYRCNSNVDPTDTSPGNTRINLIMNAFDANDI